MPIFEVETKIKIEVEIECNGRVRQLEDQTIIKSEILKAINYYQLYETLKNREVNIRTTTAKQTNM